MLLCKIDKDGKTLVKKTIDFNTLDDNCLLQQISYISLHQVAVELFALDNLKSVTAAKRGGATLTLEKIQDL